MIKCSVRRMSIMEVFFRVANVHNQRLEMYAEPKRALLMTLLKEIKETFHTQNVCVCVNNFF